MKKPSREMIRSLPIWAQEYIAKIQFQRNEAAQIVFEHTYILGCKKQLCPKQEQTAEEWLRVFKQKTQIE